jgi:hypothetical protein
VAALTAGRQILGDCDSNHDAKVKLPLRVQVELPGAFSPEHDREVSSYVDGEISAAELYRRTVSRYRRP